MDVSLFNWERPSPERQAAHPSAQTLMFIACTQYLGARHIVDTQLICIEYTRLNLDPLVTLEV